MTGRLPFHFSLSCIGEGNGNLLQCSCLENPRDGGAWWAAVYGVAQSRTRLKQLSSSSSSSRASLIAQFVKNPPAMKETLVWFLGWEDPLEKGYATHSSIYGLPLWLSWSKIRLQCGRPGLFPWIGKIPWRRERLPTPVCWPGEFHGLYSPWGRKEWANSTSLHIPFICLLIGLSVNVWLVWLVYK